MGATARTSNHGEVRPTSQMRRSSVVGAWGSLGMQSMQMTGAAAAMNDGVPAQVFMRGVARPPLAWWTVEWRAGGANDATGTNDATMWNATNKL